MPAAVGFCGMAAMTLLMAVGLMQKERVRAELLRTGAVRRLVSVRCLLVPAPIH